MLLTLSFVVHAETVSYGYYEAETSIDLVFTGSWVQVVDGDYSYMESNTLGDSVSFVVAASQVIFYRELLASPDVSAIVEICINAVCETFTSESLDAQRRVPIAYSLSGSSEYEITLENTDGGLIRLDALLALPAATLDEPLAPDAAIQYVNLNGYTVGIDWKLSGGDIAIIILLAMSLVLGFIQLRATTWK